MELKRERRTLLLAILASVLLHFAVAISLASFGDRLQPALPEDEDKPAELTLVDLAPTAPPVVPHNAPFIDTPEKRQTQEQPTEKTFESNANSIASSQLPAQGRAPVPTQDGKDRPGMDLDTEHYSLGDPGRPPEPQTHPSSTPATTPAPAPSASATSTPEPSQTPTATPRPTLEPTRTPEPEQLAMLRPTSPPTRAPQQSVATPTPQRPVPPSYRREQAQTRSSGNISNRGVASVNALGTPLGRYSKQLQDAVGSRWYMYVERQRDLVSIGTLHLRFVVDRSGRVGNLKILSNTSNEAFGNVCLQAVQDVKMPPIPEDVAATLPSEGLEEEYTFTMFPN
jgi:TonB family C-terminal domain